MTGAQTLKMLFVLKSAPIGAVAIVEEVLMILYKVYVNTYFFLSILTVILALRFVYEQSCFR